MHRRLNTALIERLCVFSAYNECMYLSIRLKEEQLKKKLAQEQQQQQKEAKARQAEQKEKKKEDPPRLKKEEEQEKELQTQTDKEVWVRFCQFCSAFSSVFCF